VVDLFLTEAVRPYGKDTEESHRGKRALQAGKAAAGAVRRAVCTARPARP